MVTWHIHFVFVKINKDIPPPTHSPLLPDKADVELAALQVFTGIAHDLVEGIFQQMVTTDDQPENQIMRTDRSVCKLRT